MEEKHTVLVVDDDKLIRGLMIQQLERNFFKVLSAEDGTSALDLFSKEKIDIVLLDVKLPDMDGMEVLQKIKTKTRQICEVIVLTGFGSDEVAIQSLRYGAVDYLEKPIDLEALNTAIGRAQEKILEKKELNFRQTILIIDDDEDIIRLMERFFRSENYHVLTAHSGKEAMEVIEKNKVDLLVSDINLGDMNGVEILEKAKRYFSDIEGIMVTGDNDSELSIKALRAGAIDYITKPINLDEVLISVQKAMERITLNRNQLYRQRELKISREIISKMNDELESRIQERSEELSHTQTQLFQTSKLATLGEMSTGLAHEMNQPLGGIALTSKHMRKMVERNRMTDEDVIEALDDIDMSVKRMDHIIKHIRTFARQEAMKFMDVNINETIESALSLMGEQLRLHGIEIQTELNADLPRIDGEPYQLEQVWINMLSNARDSMDEQGKKDSSLRKKIVIRTRQLDEAHLEIAFIDNGKGMSEETRKRMLEPFFTTKEVGKGTGLGLSISYGILQSHKGTIDCISSQGKGAEMQILLPLKLEDD
ncbi:MAG: response regulator [Planctomycetes bacterium]|nr:response regulator [Planctomycetota bacterium]